MKLTKGEFKAIIKECIKELITEGAFNAVLNESLQQTNILSNRSSSSGTKTQHVGSKEKVNKERIRELVKSMVSPDPEEDYRHGRLDGRLAEKTLMKEKYVKASPELQKLVESAATTMANGNQELASQYAAIFADTAINTIPKQMAIDSNRSGYASLSALGVNPHIEKVNEEVLQSLAPKGDMSRWAELAFGNANKK
jgi:hypothetical protein